jgi:hypothetical protein
LVTIKLSDEARRVAFVKAERLEAARSSVERLTDDECRILYVEIEARLAHAVETLTVSVAAETRPAPTDAPTELPLAEAKRIAAAAFERDHLVRGMTLSKGLGDGSRPPRRHRPHELSSAAP